jgi:pimeloyl-ACP methyl ester carboxylesterase
MSHNRISNHFFPTMPSTLHEKVSRVLHPLWQGCLYVVAVIATVTAPIIVTFAFSVLQPYSAFGQQPASAKPATAQPSISTAIAATTQNLTLNTSTGTLYGTLEVPAAAAPVPVLLFMGGGIPIDRNGNSHLYADSNNTMKMLAEALLKYGVASFRYDKRGVAQSRGACRSEDELRVEVYVQDALGWGKKLLEDKRFSSVIVLGYSESTLPAIITARTLGADGFISVAASGRSMQEIYLERARKNFPHEMLQDVQNVVASLEQGKRVDSLKYQLLYASFRPPLQPYLISSYRSTPSKELAKLSVPSLIIGGTKDFDIPSHEFKAFAAANPNAKLSLIDNMTHILRELPQELPSPTMKPRSIFANPLVPKLITDIADFVRVTSIRKKVRETAKSQQ